jgi:DNA-binding transcriptional LysR family regulator
VLGWTVNAYNLCFAVLLLTGAALGDRSISISECVALRALKSPVPTIKTAVKLVWHGRTQSDPAARAFRAIVTKAVSRPAS